MTEETTTTSTTLALGQYARALARHWLTVAAVTVLGVLAAAGYLSVAPPRVTATTQVQLYVISTDPFNPQRKSTQVLDSGTERQIAGSVAVAQLAAKSLPGVSPATVRAASEVTTTPDSAVAEVSYTAATRAGAVRGADAVADAYLSQRSAQARARVGSMLGKVTPRITTLTGELTKADRAVATTRPSSTEGAAATGARDRLRTELGSLYIQRNTLLTLDTQAGQVLIPAAQNAITYRPDRTFTLLTGFAVGLVLGVLGAVVRSRFDRRLRSARDVESAVDAPVLATIPPPSASAAASGFDAEALRVARERLAETVGEGGATVALINDTGDTAPELAVGLATVTAQAGRPVRLVLTDRASQPSSLRNLPAGVELYVPAGDEQIDDRVRVGMFRAREETLVVVAVTAAAEHATTLEVLRHADAAVPVLTVGVSRSGNVDWLREQAAIMHTPIVGAIAINRRRGRRASSASPRQPTRDDSATEPSHQVTEPDSGATQPVPSHAGAGR